MAFGTYSVVRADYIATEPHRIVLTRELKLSSLIERVEKIIEEFQSNQDSLSKQLFSWIDQIIEIISRSEDTEESSLLERISTSTQELVRTILINPLDKSPLKEPMIVQNEAKTVSEIWEKWMLDECIALFGSNSKIHPELDLSKAAPHQLAKEILKIAEEILEDPSSSTAIIPLERTAYEKKPRATKEALLNFYLSPLRQFALCKASEERRAALIGLEMKKRAEEGVSAAEAACSSLEKTVEDECSRSLAKIEEMRRENRQYEETLASMQEELTRYERDLSSITERTKELKEDVFALNELSEDLRRRITEMHARIKQFRKKSIYKFW